MTFLDCGTYVCHNCDYNVTFFKSLVYFDMFTKELADLDVHIKLFNRESTTPVEKSNKDINSSLRSFKQKLTGKKCLLEIHKLLQIYCGVALVSVVAERCFSVMRRIKIWFRSNMRGNITVSIIECLQIFIELVREHQAVVDNFASTRNTNKLF